MAKPYLCSLVVGLRSIVCFALCLTPLTNLNSKPTGSSPSRCESETATHTDGLRSGPPKTLTRVSAGRALEICNAQLQDDPSNLAAVNGQVAAAIFLGLPLTDVIQMSKFILKFHQTGHVDKLLPWYPDTLYQVANYQLKVGGDAYFTEAYRLMSIAAMAGEHARATAALWSLWADKRAPSSGVPNPFDDQHTVFDLTKAGSVQNYDPEAASMLAEHMEDVFPNGWPAKYHSGYDHREQVVDLTKYPFSAVGRLSIKTLEAEYSCTASLVGNSRTLVTAAHCIKSHAILTFHQSGQPDLKADVVTKGAYARRDVTLPGGVSRIPSEAWDDWAVLDLALPSRSRFLINQNADVFAKYTSEAAATTKFWVAGYPGDLFDGKTMTYSQGCGLQVPKLSYSGSYLTSTECPAYHGLSGAPIMKRIKYSPPQVMLIGLLKGGNEKDVLKTYVVISDSLRKAIDLKVVSDLARH